MIFMGVLMEEFIKKVNELAYQSAKNGNDPFAALLVKDNKIVATTLDTSVEQSDPTSHAELDLIRTFCKENNIFSLEDYTLFSSTEPCVMCSGAIHWSRIGKVVYSVSQEALNNSNNGNLKPSCDSIVNVGKRKVEVVGPIFEDDGFQVFIDFPLVPKLIRHEKNKKNCK